MRPTLSRLRWLVLTPLLIACGEREAIPTPENVAGVWIQQCQTSAREVASCTAQGDMAFRFELRPNGSYSKTLDGFDPCSTARWSLRGTTLEFVCEGGGMTLREEWRARLVGDRLVLWDDDLGGRVLVRKGTKPSGARQAAQPDVPRTLGPLEYTVELPSGYYLGEATTVAEEFVSDAAGAVRFRFKYGHAARPVGERGSCDGYFSQLSRDDDGAMLIRCVDKPEGVFTMSCWARRPDNSPLTDEQYATAQSVCGSLRPR